MADTDMCHAVREALWAGEVDNDEGPVKVLYLGPDSAGNLLEVVVLELDDDPDRDSDLIIHAMKMRPKYRPLLG